MAVISPILIAFLVSALSLAAQANAPENPGKYTLEAVATASDNANDPTLSRRWVTITTPETKH